MGPIEIKFEAQLIKRADGVVVGVELLVRNITPKQINDVLIAQRALEVASVFHTRIGIRVHVNVYPSSLETLPYFWDGKFPVVFEVVESDLRKEDLLRQVLSLKDRYDGAFMVALDDFGAGGSNFDVLRPYHGLNLRFVDIVKIDAGCVAHDLACVLVEKLKDEGYVVYVEKATHRDVPGADGYQSYKVHRPEPWEQVLNKLMDR